MDNKTLPPSFHLDADIRIDHARHAGIVIKDKQLLLIHRIREGNEYYPLPGGHAQIGETGEQTVIREIAEETSIVVSSPRPVLQSFDPEREQTDFVYICSYVSGSPRLGGEEALKQSATNLYDPLWIDLAKLDTFPIAPRIVKTWITTNTKYLANSQ